MTSSPTDPALTPVLLAGARTPFGRYAGALSSLSAVDLGVVAVRGALERGGVAADDVDAVLLGQVVQAGSGQGPARQVAVGAGIPWRVPTTTVNKICLSGLTTIVDAARLVRLGEAHVVVAGGQESMSQAPHLLPGARAGLGYGDRSVVDGLSDALTDAFSHLSMGEETERHLEALGIGRGEQDVVALASHVRAATARREGRLGEEIVPVEIVSKRGSSLVDADEGIREDSSAEALGRLRPAFAANGRITAGNASPLSDGAAAVVVTSLAYAREHGLTPLARIAGAGQVAGPDNSLHAQPARASLAALDRVDWKVEDLDVVEFSEAFAAVVVESCRTLGLRTDQVNVDGGAIAIGHPVGASGARLALHAAYALRRNGGGRAVAALCGGGGQGEALLLAADL